RGVVVVRWLRLQPCWQQVVAAAGVGDGAAVVNGSGVMIVTGAWPESSKRRGGAGCVGSGGWWW
nr:hypothetical protein [Tanacetum cinerariifolium]